MVRKKPGVDSKNDPGPEPEGLNLTELLQTRVSPDVERLVGDRAKAAGLSNSAWLRVMIHRVLGLTKE